MVRAGWLSGALLLGVALALVSWRAGVLDTAGFEQLNNSLTQSGGGTASLVAVLAAFAIGASMIVLPCGFPSVFVVPAVLSSRERLDQRLALGLLFLGGSALLLAAAGVVLGFAGAGILDLLPIAFQKFRDMLVSPDTPATVRHMRPATFTFSRRAINPLIHACISSGSDSSRNVAPVGAVSKTIRS
jgi:hypothetical protein